MNNRVRQKRKWRKYRWRRLKKSMQLLANSFTKFVDACKKVFLIDLNEYMKGLKL